MRNASAPLGYLSDFFPPRIFLRHLFARESFPRRRVCFMTDSLLMSTSVYYYYIPSASPTGSLTFSIYIYTHTLYERAMGLITRRDFERKNPKTLRDNDTRRFSLFRPDRAATFSSVRRSAPLIYPSLPAPLSPPTRILTYTGRWPHGDLPTRACILPEIVRFEKRTTARRYCTLIVCRRRSGIAPTENRDEPGFDTLPCSRSVY